MNIFKKRGHCDYSLLFIILFMLCLGLVMLYSTSSYSAQIKFGDSAWYLKKQAFITIGGVFLMIVVSRMDYHFFANFAFIGFIVAHILVLLVMTPLGIEANGARRWLNLGITSFQPAEFVKLAVILYLAYKISKSSRQTHKVSYIIKIVAYALPLVAMILFITSNMSSAIIVFAIAVILIFVASPKYKPFIAMGGGAVGVLALYLLFAGGYRAERIRAWLNPELYASESGYQVLQGLYAIGSGGLFGKGLGRSVQKLGYVPEAQNDMVFAIICEELGFIGAIAIIVLFVFMIWRFMVVASNAPDLFGSLLLVGIMAHISVQVILNIAVVTNTIPNTGITLPFISYGGTSILFLLIEMGMALSVSRAVYNQENI